MRRAVLAVIGIALVWLAWTRLFPSDEAQIQAVLARIAASLDNRGAESDQGRTGPGVAGLGRLAALQNEFAADVSVDAGPPFDRLQGRQAVVSAAARVHMAVRNLTLSFPDVSITVANDRQTANAAVTARAEFDGREGRAVDARELTLQFSRHDGRWLIASVTMVQALERLDTR
jgi:hypothetical protein